MHLNDKDVPHLFQLVQFLGSGLTKKSNLTSALFLPIFLVSSRTVKIPCVENGNEYREILLKIMSFS